MGEEWRLARKRLCPDGAELPVGGSRRREKQGGWRSGGLGKAPTDQQKIGEKAQVLATRWRKKTKGNVKLKVTHGPEHKELGSFRPFIWITNAVKKTLLVPEAAMAHSRRCPAHTSCAPC